MRSPDRLHNTREKTESSPLNRGLPRGKQKIGLGVSAAMLIASGAAGVILAPHIATGDPSHPDITPSRYCASFVMANSTPAKDLSKPYLQEVYMFFPDQPQGKKDYQNDPSHFTGEGDYINKLLGDFAYRETGGIMNITFDPNRLIVDMSQPLYGGYSGDKWPETAIIEARAKLGSSLKKPSASSPVVGARFIVMTDSASNYDITKFYNAGMYATGIYEPEGGFSIYPRSFYENPLSGPVTAGHEDLYHELINKQINNEVNNPNPNLLSVAATSPDDSKGLMGLLLDNRDVDGNCLSTKITPTPTKYYLYLPVTGKNTDMGISKPQIKVKITNSKEFDQGKAPAQIQITPASTPAPYPVPAKSRK